jgi:hypothetical protein
VCQTELTENLPCFFDLQITSVLEILQVSSKTLAMARTESETELREWPFNKVKAGAFEMGWADIKQARAAAIASASPTMRACLFLAERKAVLMRALYMPKGQQYRLALVPFPNEDGLGGDEEDAPIPAARPAVMIPAACEPQAASYRRIPALRRMEEIASILPCLIDIPIRTVAQDILGMSQHALLGVRKGVGMAQWPAEYVQKGGGFGVPSAEEVARLRADTLASLPPDSRLARILTQANRVAREQILQREQVFRRLVFPFEAAVAVPVDEPATITIEASPLFPDDDLPPPPAPLDDGWDFRWDDDDDSWMTADERAYWRDICDMPPP